MSSTAYLDNNATVEKLKSERDKRGRFVGGDERGMVAVCIANERVDFVEVAEFAAAGVRRGFHYRTKSTETLYVVSGKVRGDCKDINSGNQVCVELSEGMRIMMSPVIAHAFISDSPALIISAGIGADPFVDRHSYFDFTLDS